MRTLYGIKVSQYTEKARFALDHHAIAYTYHEHLPLLGELFLRNKSKNRAPGTKATVPLLVDGDVCLTSSLAIARHADRTGSGAPLFGAGEDEAVERWANLSDQIIEVGRVRIFQGMREDRQARLESTPAWVPGALRGLFAPGVAMATNFLGQKHRVDENIEAVVARARTALDEARGALAKGRYLVGDAFGFADVAVASALGVVRPHADAPLGPAMRAILTEPSLSADFEDLLTWRDEVYRQHRKAPVSAS